MSSALTPGAIRDVAAAPLRSIRDDVGFFAARFGASSASLIAALDAFDVEKSKNDRDVDPRALARLGALACASAMRTTPMNARRCAWALDALGGLLRIGALGGRCDGALDDDDDDAKDDDDGARLRWELLRAACACGELSGETAAEESSGDAEARARCGAGATAFALAACAGTTEDEDENARGRDSSGEASTSSGTFAPGTFRARGEALMRATRAVFHVAMIADDEATRRAAKTALTQIINAAFKRAERGFDAIARGDAVEDDGADADATRDVSLLLTTLCKIAAREGAVDVDAYLAHSKALALDILRQLMDGPRATVWLECFHAELRQPLSIALMRNALLQVPRGSEAEQSVGILVSIARMAYGTLVVRARATWKQQVAALYPIMALHPLESGDASAAMRVSALRLVRRLASDSQVLVDMFVNYDCDLHAANLYERTVMALAQSAQVADVLERDAVLTCLFSILRSLQSWHARGENGVDDASVDIDDNDADVSMEDEDGFDGELRPAVSRRALRKLKSGGGATTPIGSIAAAAAAATVAVVAGDDGPSTPTSPTHREEKIATAPTSPSDSPSSPSCVNSPSAAVESEAERFQKAKKTKASMEKAVEAFNVDPSTQTLRVAARSEDPNVCAEFLRKTSARVAPAAIGELLGSPDADALVVMRAYVHRFDFASMSIDDAMRLFLGGFKLPGEAQKIDRLVEAFAARFCACNPGAYPSADAAYILAFAIVMLNTDAHNPLTDAAMKMSEGDFVLMATAAEATKDLDVEAVAAIYARVTAEEIKMHAAEPSTATKANGGDNARAKKTMAQVLNFAAPWKNRSTLKEASDETVELLKSTKAMFKHAEESDEAASALFVRASEPGLARPMLEAAGKCMLIALSSAFDSAPDEAHAAMPLEGARAMLSLAARLQLPMLRDDICTFLVSAPGFGRREGIATQSKEALSTLLELAASESNLGGVQAWASVLEMVTRLENLRAVVGAGVSFDTARAKDIFCAPLRMQELVASSKSATQSGGDVSPDALTPAELSVTQWLSTAGGEAIERVFALSTRFDSDEIIAYASAIATVSRHELWDGAGGNVSALLRLTEVAATNMTRVRLVWSKLWNVVAEHLVESVKHPDDKVVLHATDSLRQVANRLLLRARATRSATQVDAMKPFVAAIENAPNAHARDLISSCVAQALQRFGDSLDLGWDPALEVLEHVYGDGSSSDVALGDAEAAACEALEKALAAALEKNGDSASKVATEDDDDYLGLPLACVPRAMCLLGTFARRRRRASAGSDDEGSPPRRAVATIAAACRRGLAMGDEDANAWLKTTWAATCETIGALAREDDRALDALFRVLEDDDVERLSAEAWGVARAGAVEGLLETKLDATRALDLILPRLIALVRDKKSAYDALLPAIWSFVTNVLRAAAPRAIPDALAATRSAMDVVIARGDSSVDTWRAICKVLRYGVVVDVVMLDLPNASDVVSRSLACVAACADLRGVVGVPESARSELVDIITDAYAFAREENDAEGSLGTLSRLEFAAGDALLRALRGDVDARERLVEHASRCLVIHREARESDKENTRDGDACLRSNALTPTRERLAARALASLVDFADADVVAQIAPHAIDAIRSAHRAPLSTALASFFDSRAVVDRIGI